MLLSLAIPMSRRTTHCHVMFQQMIATSSNPQSFTEIYDRCMSITIIKANAQSLLRSYVINPAVCSDNASVLDCSYSKTHSTQICTGDHKTINQLWSVDSLNPGPWTSPTALFEKADDDPN
jgi:hypothetical protein